MKGLMCPSMEARQYKAETEEAEKQTDLCVTSGSDSATYQLWDIGGIISPRFLHF